MTATDTPMLRQYTAIKAMYQKEILFFRLGDFYEMFLDDALIASKALSLTLTGRGKDENRIPMCGVPHHAADGYIAKLVQQGFKVAICEQVEDPSIAKGITKREVVKVITPGTIMDDAVLNANENQFIASIFPHKTGIGFAIVDITTGDFLANQVSSATELQHLLFSHAVKEVLVPNSIDELDFNIPEGIIQSPYSPLLTQQAETQIKAFFNIQSLDAFGIGQLSLTFPAIFAILDYLKSIQKSTLSQLTRIRPLIKDNILHMDAVTQLNLELTKSRTPEAPKNSLFYVLNDTKTAMGARLLNQWIRTPLREVTQIDARLDGVSALLDDRLSREEIRETLSAVFDLERLITRIVSETNNPKDLLALNDSLIALTDLPSILAQLNAPALESWIKPLGPLFAETGPIQNIKTLIQTSIREEAPGSLKDGKVINPEFSTELKDLLNSFADIRNWIASLEETERKSTGIPSLKVRFNKVFGYYIEISHTHQAKTPEHYIRKQTLTNAERYITPELKEKETILLNGESQQIELETKIYQDIVDTIKNHITSLQELAQCVANIDVLQSLASVAQRHGYKRPTFDEIEKNTLVIENGKHPILSAKDAAFIPNTIQMTDQNRFMLITGPNMAGKSTIMRQTGLLIVMAQLGSFVPAATMHISVVDKLFTRIGALDNLYFGQSTFMVEMLETASILNNATEDSFILLDEIGRGTATYDGMSIAGAITEHIHSIIKARTLFATHYHELTHFETHLQHLQNTSMKIDEVDGKLIFRYKLISGPADKSYGVHVAEMAGLPASLIKRANALLASFESINDPSNKINGITSTVKPESQLELF